MLSSLLFVGRIFSLSVKMSYVRSVKRTTLRPLLNWSS
jgi:hypothetical protein